MLSALVALLVAATIVGCASETSTPSGYAVVVGARANTSLPDLGAATRDLPTDLAAGSTVTLTGVSGSPTGDPLGRWNVSDGTVYDRESEISAIRAQIVGIGGDAIAAGPEADVLGAINAAARSIGHVDGDRVIVVADSMLATAGALPFQSGLLDSSVEDISASVPDEMLAPQLGGATIIVQGLGSVASPQQPLSQAQVAFLEAVWRELLAERGGATVEFRYDAAGGGAPDGQPHVTPVLIDAPVPAAVAPDGCEVRIPEASVRFQPDSAAFVDAAAARANLADVVASIATCSGTITVAGTTSSWGDAAGRAEISLARAVAGRALVADILGVPVDTIAAVGLGMDHPGYLPDRLPDGSLDPIAAAANRGLIITIH